MAKRRPIPWAGGTELQAQRWRRSYARIGVSMTAGSALPFCQPSLSSMSGSDPVSQIKGGLNLNSPVTTGQRDVRSHAQKHFARLRRIKGADAPEVLAIPPNVRGRQTGPNAHMPTEEPGSYVGKQLGSDTVKQEPGAAKQEPGAAKQEVQEFAAKPTV